MKRVVTVCGFVLCLLVFAHPALANHLTEATATATCNGFTLTVDAVQLNSGTSYTIKFTFTLMPTSGPPITVPGTINFSANGSTATETTSGTWPGAPLAADFTLTGSAVLTSSGSTVPIIINGSSAAPLSCGLDGRMTGGGSVFETDGTRVTHGFELHCDTEDVPNRLEINWAGHRFHLETLVSAFCFKDSTIDAGHPTNIFNTYVGFGTGLFDGTLGATAHWTFTDAGEPGTNDKATIVIKDSHGTVVLSVSGKLHSGNQQAHKDNK
ncbi:MAG TPA: hypothetical protein VKQ28_00590 [Candidatus Acidoferrum sp.]|nr:hypothetical protein [Candidatus Acidoferrum sp.]